MPPSAWSRRIIAAVLVSSMLFSASTVMADQGTPTSPDTVVLKDGSMLRGTVVEEDPKLGVTIQLLDGTTRKVAKAALDHVEYASAPVATAAPATAAPPPALAPVIYPTAEPTPTEGKRPNRAMMITGLVMMPLGAIAIAGGVPYYINASKDNTAHFVTGCDSNGICGYGSETYHDSDGQTIAAALIIGGAIVLTVGAILTIVGSHRRASATTATTLSAPASACSITLGSTTSPVYVGTTPNGLALRF